jgi:hypothetical protein
MTDLREKRSLTVNALAGDAFICGDIERITLTFPDGTELVGDIATAEVTIDEHNVVRKRYVMVEKLS